MLNRPTPPANVVVISGDFSRPEIERALEEVGDGSPAGLVIELSGTTSIDPAVHDAMLETVRTLRAREVPCAVVCDARQLLRMFGS